MSNPVLDAAIAYVSEYGWSVIPISPRSKKPPIKWKEYQQRHPTEEELRSWWKKWPDANVAIVTGAISGIVVADVDPDRGGDANEWAIRYPSNVGTNTRRGGRHFYYRAPSGGEKVRNSVGTVALGVDVRGEGGYVLAPPSKGYAWTGNVKVGIQHSFSEWPSPDGGLRFEGGSGAATTEHWIERTLQGVGSGERNNAAARLAGYFLSKGSPADVVTQQLLAWNRLNDPPLPDSDIRIVVESVARTDRDRRDGRSSRLSLNDPSEDETADGDVGRYTTIDFAAYLSKYGHQTVKWLVDGWLPRETVGMVVAPPGSYKTWLLQDLAISVSTGMPFLGQFPVNKPGPVLFMQQEDWHGQIAHRFALIAFHRAGLEQPRMERNRLLLRAPPKIPIYLHEHRRFRFGDAEIIDSWIETIKRLRPSLVVLDPLYSAGSVDDFMAGTARDMFLFKQIRDAFGTTFLIAHHTKKQSKSDNGKRDSNATPEREDIWGSQFLNAWLETGWQIRRHEELGSATILRHFKVQSETAKAIISFNIDTTQLPTKYDVAVREGSEGQIADEGDVDIVRLLEIGGTMSVAALVKATGLPRTNVYRRLEPLMKGGIVKQSGVGYTLTEALDA